jgi:NAD(P)-dependent dehydrogenase (short-subunit alcohol dehydrogenase family)
VLIYNSGAIWWSSVAQTPMKRFQLMQRVNIEGLYGMVQAVLPHLHRNGDGKKGAGRIVVVSPPVYSRFFRGKTAYAMGKVGMSVLTMGLAMDFEREGRADTMAITSIWPAAVGSSIMLSPFSFSFPNPTIMSNDFHDVQAIDSAATQKNQRPDQFEEMQRSLRKPEIFSDAILAILRAPTRDVSGKVLLDEDFLRDHEGVTDFSKYALIPGATPRRIMPESFPDLRVREQDDEGDRVDSVELRKAKL